MLFCKVCMYGRYHKILSHLPAKFLCTMNLIFRKSLPICVPRRRIWECQTSSSVNILLLVKKKKKKKKRKMPQPWKHFLLEAVKVASEAICTACFLFSLLYLFLSWNILLRLLFSNLIAGLVSTVLI